MKSAFSNIGLFAKPTGADIGDTLKHLIWFLKEHKHKVYIEESSAVHLEAPVENVLPSNEIAKKSDLIIVIGGDGSLLKAARAIVDSKTPILGINRGNLGFLADVNPHHLESTLTQILAGKYYKEQRTMLQINIIQQQKSVGQHLALNDVVLHHGDIARLIEFQIFIDDHFVVDQRADGIITSTPTGSTAYALSGGGPIVYPTLDVITLMAMFPHALNTRPIVIPKYSKIKLRLTPNNRIDAKISCDGQTHMTLSAGDEVHIQAHPHDLILLHPESYNYFTVLREKLGWNHNVNATDR